MIKYSEGEFKRGWITDEDESGILMTVEPTPAFYKLEKNRGKSSLKKYCFLLGYLKPYKKLIIQLVIGLFAGSLLQLLLPFLTQAIVDIGIGNKDISFIELLLIAQIVLILSRTFIDFIRRILLLHIGTRVNVSLISDFLTKLSKLPIKFFDSKLTGDLIRRIDDQKKIETFLTTSLLNIIFSVFTIIIFSVVLIYYNLKIFSIFFIGSLLYFLWIKLFLKRRAELDYKNFSQMAKNQNYLIEFIQSMPDIKLAGCESQKKWKWKTIQAKIFRISIKALNLNQYQETGAVFINEVKNVIITFYAASLVITGDISFGIMISIQFIIGQLQSPIDQSITFIQTAQDARLSFDRLNELQNIRNEEELQNKNTVLEKSNLGAIQLQNIQFSYNSSKIKLLIDGLSLNIPYGGKTAIVGYSGSGKTTLIKLMLGFYPLLGGEIKINNVDLKDINLKEWRNRCGVVMQDGYIFSDTIVGNIAPEEDRIDEKKLENAAKIANLDEFINSLPLNYYTRIGNAGMGLSQGQKQRILIARAVYKDPDYIFLDEATNSLDATNEKTIINNLNVFFKSRTVIVVAHRLSTVKDADQIVVLNDGKIEEIGTHDVLIKENGSYYNLIKDQLEVG